MDRRCYANPFVHEQDDPSENAPYSPSSGDESKVTTTSSGPSPKKRKGVQKRVVTVPIGDSDGGKSRGEAYPPSDSWAWRKYGQKPIKGSPYPRGYYRCSSSKGCPARKQVERSRVDPTTLLITYASEHNHPLPTAKHHHQPSSTATSSASAAASGGDSPPTVKPEPEDPAVLTPQPEDPAVFTPQPDLDLVGGDGCLVLPPELDWYTTDVALLESHGDIFDGFEIYGNDDMREEDASLFGDLGELPECSVVFRRSAAVTCVGNSG